MSPEPEFEPVGGTETFKVDTRLVLATNQDLEESVRKGEFREDLYYRLCVVPITLPPLRQRKDEIIPLLNHYLQFFAEQYQVTKQLDPEAVERLINYSWPGNVRELANAIEHATILCDSGPIGAEHLPRKFAAGRSRGPSIKLSGPPRTLREIELEVIKETLDRHAGSKPKAAEELGISLKTLYNKLNQASALDKSA